MYETLAKKIPDKIRSERLMIKADPIENVQAVSGNQYMQLLFGIYTEFVFPNKEEDLYCALCCQRIIHCFQQMKPHLVKLEKQYKLLTKVKPR